MMPALNQTFKFSALSLLLGGLLGCTNLAQTGIGVSEIGDIQQNWQKYSTVYVKGTVEKQAPFLGTGAYQVQDATGTIWVVTQESLPSQGDEVLLKGQVKYQSIPIAGQELGEVYVDEVEQLQRKSTQQ